MDMQNKSMSLQFWLLDESVSNISDCQLTLIKHLLTVGFTVTHGIGYNLKGTCCNRQKRVQLGGDIVLQTGKGIIG